MDPTLSLYYLPTALMLGVLHALEPGHAKTLTAAYLIGIRGTRWDAVLLGSSVAVTHSAVVIALSAAALWFGREAFTDQATHILQLTSGGVVILLGLWLIYRRWPRPRPHGHGVPDPVVVEGWTLKGRLTIAPTEQGERMCLEAIPGLATAVIEIQRPFGIERLVLSPIPDRPERYQSAGAPDEPHDFDAKLRVKMPDGQEEVLDFTMHEPRGHGHDNPDDVEHARSHAADLPDYVSRGERPSPWQIVAFGAAGGLIPCPASVTVMLLALSVNATGLGLITVLAFSCGLAVTLVGVGLAIVAGLSQLARTGRFAAVTRHASLISAFVVLLSGAMALIMVH